MYLYINIYAHNIYVYKHVFIYKYTHVYLYVFICDIYHRYDLYLCVYTHTQLNFNTLYRYIHMHIKFTYAYVTTLHMYINMCIHIMSSFGHVSICVHIAVNIDLLRGVGGLWDRGGWRSRPDAGQPLVRFQFESGFEGRRSTSQLKDGRRESTVFLTPFCSIQASIDWARPTHKGKDKLLYPLYHSTSPSPPHRHT